MQPVRFLILFTLLLCGGACYTSHAQTYTVKGTVIDTLNLYKLENASITLIRAKDSILHSYTRTTADGHFELHPDTAGKYLLMITYVGFADFIDVIDVQADKPVDVGEIIMMSRSHLLQEFVLRQTQSSIRINGDTTEYFADSFAVREGANVEALLKKLPGITVNKNGEITAQGESVARILVDGEEFFSDDPAVVTKNLQANAVERVQVYNQQSEQSQFTGIDDGQTSKTINLQLKEDKKKGYFGKLTAGAGPGEGDNFFENQGMLNAFRGKRKLSIFGIVANTGQIGLGWQDRDKFGSSSNMEVTEDGVITYYGGDDDDDFESWSGRYEGQGLPKAWTGGAHYSNKWNEDMQHLGGNYRYAKQNIETIGSTLTQYTLPDSAFYTMENRNLFSSGQRHRGDLLYEWKPDSTSTLKVTVNAGISQTRSSSVYQAESFAADSSLANETNRTLTNDATTRTINATALWRKKLGKPGRTISINLSENYRESEGDGLLNSLSKLYLDSVNFFPTSIDQRKLNNNKSLSLSGRASYTEPLSKTTFLEVNYSIKVDNSSALRESRNKLPGDSEYTVLDSIFSSNYAFNIMTNTGGAHLRFVYKKFNISAGGSVSRANFRQTDLFLRRDTTFAYNFTNFFPSANITYKITKQSNLSFYYNGSTRQASLTQLQPLRDNTDPLNVLVGNPDLTQEFRHTMSVRFNEYKVLNGRYIWGNISFTGVDDAISRSEFIDDFGRRIYKYINIDGNYNAWGYLGYGRQLKGLNMEVGGTLQVGISHMNNRVNNIENTSNNNRYTAGLRMNYTGEKEKLSLSIQPSATYFDNKTTISTFTNSYWTGELQTELSYVFPLKIEAGTELQGYVRQRTNIFDRNNDVLRWNAYVSKKLLKNGQLEIRASVFDILNQNRGFSRFAQNNYVTEDNYNAISRYGLLSLTWNFTHTAMGAVPPAGPSFQIVD